MKIIVSNVRVYTKVFRISECTEFWRVGVKMWVYCGVKINLE